MIINSVIIASIAISLESFLVCALFISYGLAYFNVRPPSITNALKDPDGDQTLEEQEEEDQEEQEAGQSITEQSTLLPGSNSAEQQTNPSAPTSTTISTLKSKPKEKKTRSDHHQSSQEFTETDSLLSSSTSGRNRRKVRHSFGSKRHHPNRSNPIINSIKSIIGLRTSSNGSNTLTFVINTTLALFSLDYTFRTVVLDGQEDLSFSRVGSVGESWVKIHVRIPPTTTAGADLMHQRDKEQASTVVGAQLIYRPMRPVGNWIPGPTLITTNETDWTTVGKIDQLLPGKAYEYRFNSLSPPGQEHPLFESVAYFQTAPDTSQLSDPKESGGSFTFAYSSCIKPGFPYNPLRNQLENDGAEQLADWSRKLKLDFILFLGDFIYVDSPIYLGNSIQNYWRKYRQSFASFGWKKIMQFTPTFHIYDDHEILNDWAGKGNDTNVIFQPANRAYRDYLGDSNFDGSGDGSNYYWFRYGDAAFFVWDCRRYRSSNDRFDDHSKTMLGIEQKNVFLSWLSAVNTTVTFKFVVSSTPFMSLWSGPDGGIDTWAGFLTERSELMDVMEYVPNLIILSGDRHEFAAASIRESVIEFSTSPLNQFWLPIQTLNQQNGLGKTGEDKLLKYIPDGIHKFSTLNVDCRDPKKPLVNFKLYIDETVAWELRYLGKPVKEELKQLGQLLPTWDQLLKLLSPIQWFSTASTPSLNPVPPSPDISGVDDHQRGEGNPSE